MNRQFKHLHDRKIDPSVGSWNFGLRIARIGDGISKMQPQKALLLKKEPTMTSRAICNRILKTFQLLSVLYRQVFALAMV
jgi:hypothetical protein